METLTLRKEQKMQQPIVNSKVEQKFLLAKKIDQYSLYAEKEKQAKKDKELCKVEIIKLQGVATTSETPETLQGIAYELEIQKSKDNLIIDDREMLRRLLGPELFDAIWALPIKLLRAHVTPAQIEKFSHTELGARTWKVKKL